MNVTGISLSGMQASMARMSASAANVANISSVGAVPGSGADGPAAYQPIRARQGEVAGGGVMTRFEPVEPGQMLVYDPRGKMADAQGMVAAPNVDLADEMVEQMSAKLAFEANVKVIGAVNDLQRRTFEMWA